MSCPGSARRGAAALLVLLSAVLLGACPSHRRQQPPSRLRVAEVRVSKLKSAPGVSLPELRGWVYERLRQARAIELVARGGAGVYRLEISITVGELAQDLTGSENKHAALLAARAEVPADVDGLVLEASRLVPLKDGRVDASREALRAGAHALVDSIGDQARLAAGHEELLVEALLGKDPARVAAAMEIAAARRARAAVPALIRLLEHRDSRIADRAIGALVAIGDQRAVRSLTRLTPFRDTERLAKVLDAIESLGGEEARTFLEFVASGHEDADIRNLAAEALARLQRRAGKKEPER